MRQIVTGVRSSCRIRTKFLFEILSPVNSIPVLVDNSLFLPCIGYNLGRDPNFPFANVTILRKSDLQTTCQLCESMDVSKILLIKPPVVDTKQ